MIVIDASALLDVLLNVPSAIELSNRVLADDTSLHAPHLIDVEITQALRRHAVAGAIDQPTGRAVLQDLVQLPLRRYPHTVLLPRIWALRSAMPAYDAAYIALAEALEAPLLTRDAKLGRAHGHNARIEVF